MLDDLFKDIDFTGIFDNLIEIYEDCMPKKFYRKFRVKGKIKRRYMIRYNVLNDLLPSPRIMRMMLRSIGSRARI